MILFNAVFLFALLMLTWVVLSGFFEVFFIGLGAFSCLLAVVFSQLISHRMGKIEKLFQTVLALPYYLAWLEWEIIKSSLRVTKRVWQVQPDISPTVDWVHTSQKDEIGVAVYANSITLTPGTVSVLVCPDMIQVHALEAELLKELQLGNMDKRAAETVVCHHVRHGEVL